MSRHDGRRGSARLQPPNSLDYVSVHRRVNARQAAPQAHLEERPPHRFSRRRNLKRLSGTDGGSLEVIELGDPGHHPRNVRGPARLGDVPQGLTRTNNGGGGGISRHLRNRRGGGRRDQAHQSPDDQSATGKHEGRDDDREPATKKPQPRPGAHRHLRHLPRAGHDGLSLAHTPSDAASPDPLLLGSTSQPGSPHCRVLRSQALQIRATTPQCHGRRRATHFRHRRQRRNACGCRHGTPRPLEASPHRNLGDEVVSDEPQPGPTGGLPGTPIAGRPSDRLISPPPRSLAGRERDGDGTHSNLLNTCSTNACSIH